MNELNSVLLEGRVSAVPLYNEEKQFFLMSIANNRYYKKDGETIHEPTFISIQAHGKLAETCGKILKKGRGVRVVGCLLQYKDENKNTILYVKAEHVEFKPEFNKKDAESQGAAVSLIEEEEEIEERPGAQDDVPTEN